MASIAVSSPTNISANAGGVYVPSSTAAPMTTTTAPYTVDPTEYAQFLAYQEWKRQQPVTFASPSPAYASMQAADHAFSSHQQQYPPVPTLQAPPPGLPPRMPPKHGPTTKSNGSGATTSNQQQCYPPMQMAYASPSPAYASMQMADAQHSPMMHHQQQYPAPPTVQPPPNSSSSLPPRMPPSANTHDSSTVDSTHQPTTNSTTNNAKNQQSPFCNPISVLSSFFTTLQGHGQQIRNLMNQARSIVALLKGCQE